MIKAQTNRGQRPELYYLRDQQGLEVDFLMPGAGGECFGIASAHGYDARTIRGAILVFCCDVAPLGARRSYTARRGTRAAEHHQGSTRCSDGRIELSRRRRPAARSSRAWRTTHCARNVPVPIHQLTDQRVQN